jgi:hypothetical protein
MTPGGPLVWAANTIKALVLAAAIVAATLWAYSTLMEIGEKGASHKERSTTRSALEIMAPKN